VLQLSGGDRGDCVTPLTTGTIYGLVDPRTHEVRYVGQTTRPIEVRLAGHLAAPAPLVRAWVEELAFEGHCPEIIALRENVPVAGLDAAEKEEIKEHAARGDLLNTASNELGNARRRKVSREEAKRRKAEEEAMQRTWHQAAWRQVADQVRAATGGPLSPADIPIREIPSAVWGAYRAYHEANQRLNGNGSSYLLHSELAHLVTGRPARDPEMEAVYLRRSNAQAGLEQYFRAYCGTFTMVDEGDHRSREGVFGRGSEDYKTPFRDPDHMARYLSLIPWAARALEPWVELAEEAGIDPKSPHFKDWISDDPATREAVELYRQTAPGWMGGFRQSWDRTLATYMLALGAAQIPDFVVPELLKSELRDRLTELARDRQLTREMSELLLRINPSALDAVYGKDELAESDEALGLPQGTSAQVILHVYGGDSRNPNDRAAKLIQRHTGSFDTVDVPDYSGWTGPHVPGMRSGAASFASAGLFSEAEPSSVTQLLTRVRSTWMPGRHGYRELEKLEERMRGTAVHAPEA
jgi:hypothetical protein